MPETCWTATFLFSSSFGAGWLLMVALQLAGFYVALESVMLFLHKKSVNFQHQPQDLFLFLSDLLHSTFLLFLFNLYYTYIHSLYSNWHHCTWCFWEAIGYRQPIIHNRMLFQHQVGSSQQVFFTPRQYYLRQFWWRPCTCQNCPMTSLSLCAAIVARNTEYWRMLNIVSEQHKNDKVREVTKQRVSYSNLYFKSANIKISLHELQVIPNQVRQ